jgi:hypothetical protein
MAKETWGRRTQIALSLGLALLFAGIAGGLLYDLAARKNREATPVVHFSRTPVPPSEIPYGSPTEVDPFQWPSGPPERYDGEYPRWNLKDLPQGWDPKLASQIHSYFEMMTVDNKDEEKLANLSKIRDDFKDFLAGLGPEALPTLGTILNAEADFVNRRFLLYAIGGLGPQSEAATFLLRDFFMARQGDPQNLSEMYHVIWAMKDLQNDTSFSTLSHFIENPDLEPYREKLVEALGDHRRREEAASVFVDRMRSDDDTKVRNKAAQALGKVKSPDTLGELYAAIDKERYWATKQTMLGSIGKIGDPTSVPFLEDKARNSTEDAVRLSAAGALRRIGTPEAWQILRDLEKAEPKESIRNHIKTWIAEGEKGLGK